LVQATVVVLVLTSCSGSERNGDGGDGSTGAKGGAKATKSAGPPPVKFTLNPAVGATGVAPASQISLSLDRGKLATVAVRSARGDEVDGSVTPDGTRWVSRGKLAFGATYSVQATTSENSAAETVGSFSTAPVPGGGKSVRASSMLGDGRTYGVAMPIILKLNNPVRETEQRAAFEKTLTVRSTPATAGAWGWVNSREVHFRPRTYWAAGSKVHLKVDSAGRSLGNGFWSRTDMTVDFKIGTRREVKVDSGTKMLQVLENGRLVKTAPVSLGRPKYPSSSGTMVLIDKRPEAMFDSSTYGLAVNSPDGYRTKVQYPMRLTWGGEFIHSAPWSVADQGKRNVSHGCINVAPANALWLYQRVQVGDPVTVTRTETKVKQGDGWTAWSVDFATWLKESATGERQTSAAAATPAAATAPSGQTPGTGQGLTAQVPSRDGVTSGASGGGFSGN
jgi:lipoprotein-anchoring transpeptidase ErfK/SrfK